MDMREHLSRPLDEGGHGHEPYGYSLQTSDPHDLHEEDHEPGAWWAEAISHAHA
jgi:hypothetical protein